MHELAFVNLRDAIIMQAVLDYCESTNIIAHPYEHNVATVREAAKLLEDTRAFFQSDWYAELMNGAPYNIYNMLLRGEEVCLTTVESAISQTTSKSSDSTDL